MLEWEIAFKEIVKKKWKWKEKLKGQKKNIKIGLILKK